MTPTPGDPGDARLAAVMVAAEDLARAEAAAAAARTVERDAIREVERRGNAATDPSSSDADVEDFAAWLPHGERRITLARQRSEQAEAAVAVARVALNAARDAQARKRERDTQRSTPGGVVR